MAIVGRLLEKKIRQEGKVQRKASGTPKSGKILSGKPTPLKKVIMKPKSVGTSATKGGDIRRYFPVKNDDRKFDRKLKLIENFVDKLKNN